MGLFSKKPEPEPVRRGQVMKLINAGMKETQAADKEDGSSDFRQAKADFERELRRSSQAERRAALDALRRHGH